MKRGINRPWRARRTHTPVVLVAIMSMVGILSACGGGSAAMKVEDDGGDAPVMLSDSEWSDVVAAAKNEGELVVYTSSGPTEAAFKRFSDTYPDIKITVERQPTADLITRLDQEISVNAAGADVAVHGQEVWYADRGQARSLAPLKLSPESQKNFTGLEVDRYYVPVSKVPYSFAYNTMLGQPVKTMEEFLRVVGDKPVGLHDAANAIATSYQYYRWQESYGDDFLQRLAAHNPAVFGSGSTMSQSLAAGEIVYGIAQSPGYIAALKAQGAPVDEVVLSDAVVGAQYGPGILATSRHPNAAQVFVNWVMSPEGQKILLEAQGGTVPTEIEGSLKWDSVELAPWTPDEQEGWLKEQWNPALRR
ncbi:MAG: extracellular solute-binding protein [Rhodococcus sp. (in: high G+C Gram-positive bacteria)]|nr:MAG: extracellular solute-binding protein [Rhodococcus sp. (in: high G+C Gram-positive bacteria)]